MCALSISEVAVATGFPPSTLRYYESIGLLPPPERGANGYRAYHEDTVRRLRLIGRAKALGLTLDEARGVAELWTAEPCQAVQDHLRRLVAAKASETQSRIEELQAFHALLAAAGDALGKPAVDGPCADACRCFDPNLHQTVGDVGDDGELSCSLDPNGVAARLDAWRSLLDRAEVDRSNGTIKARFDAEVELPEVVQLIEAERRCCAFLSFCLIVDPDGSRLTIGGPQGAEPVLAALGGWPAETGSFER